MANYYNNKKRKSKKTYGYYTLKPHMYNVDDIPTNALRRLEKCNGYFDFYYPQNYGQYKDVYTPEDYYVIRDLDLLKYQLYEIFANPYIPDIRWKNKYISKGILHFNQDNLYNIIVPRLTPDIILPPKKDISIFSQVATDYIADTFYNNLMDSTEGMGNIIAYRMRYIMPPYLAFIDAKTVKTILWVISKDIMQFSVAYAYVPFTEYSATAVDFIIANGPYNKHARLHGKHTLYNYMYELPRVINSDLELAINNINPKTRYDSTMDNAF